jgi:hypothetical protein
MYKKILKEVVPGSPRKELRPCLDSLSDNS